MARYRRLWNEAKRRKKKIFTKVRRRQNERGERRETHVFGLLEILLNEGMVTCIANAKKHSWMNHVLKADCAAQRLRDGKWVPIQVKATGDDKEEFLRKYEEWRVQLQSISCEQRDRWLWCSTPPIVIIAPADGFYDPQSRAFALLRDINSWRGAGFDYQPWMRENYDLFKIERFSRFHRSLLECAQEFMRRHPAECSKARGG